MDELGRLRQQDVLIEGGKITKIGVSLEATSSAQVFNVKEKLVIPGMVDLHVHLREPGFEHKETIATATAAAAAGGFTTIGAMPNTIPCPDTAQAVKKISSLVARNAKIRVLLYGSISMDSLGAKLADLKSLAATGCIGVTDDGRGVQATSLMLEAMRVAKDLGLTISAHCEDDSLKGGTVHAGQFAHRHGLSGIPSVCESVHVARDLELAKASGAHYHVCHVSTKETVELVRQAKRDGVNVSAEVTPHHLVLCDEDIPGLDTDYKMNPPLRRPVDRDALVEGIQDGTIDFIASDHAPHTREEKSLGMNDAPFGVVGLETAFPILYTRLVLPGIISLKKLVDSLTAAPSKSFGLPFGTLKAHVPADVTVIDLEHEDTIDPSKFASKGQNTPFKGQRCKGWPIMTIFNGQIAYVKGMFDL